jgi:hypothetical protein
MLPLRSARYWVTAGSEKKLAGSVVVVVVVVVVETAVDDVAVRRERLDTTADRWVGVALPLLRISSRIKKLHR